MTTPAFPKTPRRTGWDYSIPHAYFLTIAVHRRKHRFGKVVNGELVPNAAGRLIAEVWASACAAFPDVDAGASIVMPDHVHGIIYTGADGSQQATDVNALVDRFKSVSTVQYIRGVRAGAFPTFDKHLWQPSYWDRIIRNQTEHDALVQYILSNPVRWEAKRRGNV